MTSEAQLHFTDTNLLQSMAFVVDNARPQHLPQYSVSRLCHKIMLTLIIEWRVRQLGVVITPYN